MTGPDPERGDRPALLWTPDEVCAALGCRRSWLYDQVQAGQFPVVRLGRQLRFRPTDITAYLDAHIQPATDKPSRPPPLRAPRRRRRTRPPTGHWPGEART